MRARPLAGLVLGLAAYASTAAAATVHYVVFRVDRGDRISLFSDQLVEVSTEPRSGSRVDTQVATPRSRRAGGEERVDDITLEISDRSGRVTFQTDVKLERWIRSEWPDPETGEMHLEMVQPEETAFAVRVPVSAGNAVSVLHRRTGARWRFDLRDAPRSGLPHAAVNGVAANSVSPSNRLDLLVVGDGYTSAEQSKFNSDAATLQTGFFGLTPYAEYSNYVQMATLFVASNQSGADHPPCSTDPYHVSDPKEGTYADTAFDATYCSYNQQRLLTVSNAKVLTAAAGYPDADKLLVIVNDTLYGGSGGQVLVSSLATQAVQLMQHEFGHTFTGLTDEYTAAYPGFPACSDISGSSPCEANATNQTSRSLIKWTSWIDAATAIPTPSSDTTHVGLFQGARYQTSGYYRPKYDCFMNHLGVPFCEVCRSAFILKLYNGWTRSDGTQGDPSAGIDMIEPGSESPATGSPVTTSPGATVQYGFTLLEPAGGPPATITWYVDGVAQTPGHSTTFQHAFATNGNHTITVNVLDATTAVKAAMAGSSLQTSRTWSVTVSGVAAPTNFTAAASSSQVVLSWAAVSGADQYAIARKTNNGAFTTITTIAATGSPSYTDAGVTPNNAYIYKVQGLASGTPGGYSSVDLATVFAPTDETLTTSTVIKAAHLTELRSAIDLARTAAGLGAATYTRSITTGATVLASDLEEMRTAIAQARSNLGMSAYTFTDTLTAGSTTIKKIHVDQMRAAIR